MREIKYRGWHKIYKEMFHVASIRWDENDNIISIRSQIALNWDPEDGGEWILEAEEVELMQYTNRKDKNGKEIWKSDILQFSDKWEWNRGKFAGGILAKENDYEEVMSDHNKYPYERRVVNIPEDYEWLLSSELQTYWEVIGNIYENPELLTNK